jgi:nicotinate-nucleotide adenylyltransferase
MRNVIGIFGGTFDPIHHGHLRIALDMQEALQLEQVRFLPLNQAVHREQPVASAEQRVQMLQLAVQGQPRLAVDETEIVRGGASYMVDTLETLHVVFPNKKLCLLLGSDAFNDFAQWKGPQRILQLANIIVMQRPGYKPPENHTNSIHFQPVTQLQISSSDIRQRIAQRRNVDFLLPKQVQDYIQQHRLYGLK